VFTALTTGEQRLSYLLVMRLSVECETAPGRVGICLATCCGMTKLAWTGRDTYRIRAFDAAKLVLHIEQLVTDDVRLVAARMAERGLQ
jgi:hypothetical protein